MLKKKFKQNRPLTYILAILLILPLFMCWTYHFLLILDTGDSLFTEKLSLLILLLIHLLLESKPTTVDITPRKLTSILIAIASIFIGFYLDKKSLMAISFVFFISSSTKILTTGQNNKIANFLFLSMLPLLFPINILPFGEYFSMQSFTAIYSTKLISLFYDVSLIDSKYIILPSLNISIDRSCDGVNFIRFNLALAIYSSLYTTKLHHLFIRVLAAISLAIGLNLVRILTFAILSQLGYQEFAFQTGHAFIGHVMLILGIFPLIWFSPLPDRWQELILRLNRR